MISATTTTRECASTCLDAGLSVVPIRGDGSKACTVPWRPFQKALPTPQDLQRWFIANNVGIAIVHGKVSGGSEVIDVDDGEIFEPYCEEVERLAPGLIDRLTIIQTPRPGYHLIYRCSEIGGNQKLAQADGKCLIETRGEGGYTLAPGCPVECHPTGRTYEHYAGPPLAELPTITPGERRALLQAASTFDESEVEETQTASLNGAVRGGGLSPGDDYNQRVEWPDILASAGWVQTHHNGDKTHWRRPGKSAGWSATTGCLSAAGNDLFCCFTDNAHPFDGAANGRPCSTYTKFAAYSLLNHAGDFTAAARELGWQGYGDATNMQKHNSCKPDPAEHENPFKSVPIEKYDITELIDKFPTLHEPVIEGLCRIGETVNIISDSKVGKSWLVLGLAVSIATGEPWLGQYATKQGRVLIIDNELHKPTLGFRLRKVAHAMGLFPADLKGLIEVWPMRGKLCSWNGIEEELKKYPKEHFSLAVYDAKYRFVMQGVSENDNNAETMIYNKLDGIAIASGAVNVLVHHASKGSQAEKKITDVGAGAGAQSRAADCHLVIRQHEDEKTAVLDAVVRSFAPVEPTVIRWEFPLWVTDISADPSKLKGKLTKNEQRQGDRDKEGQDLALGVLIKGPATARSIRDDTGISKDRVERVLGQLVLLKQIHYQKATRGGNVCNEYFIPENGVVD